VDAEISSPPPEAGAAIRRQLAHPQAASTRGWPRAMSKLALERPTARCPGPTESRFAPRRRISGARAASQCGPAQVQRWGRQLKPGRWSADRHGATGEAGGGHVAHTPCRALPPALLKAERAGAPSLHIAPSEVSAGCTEEVPRAASQY
jgi:hypothetical protein